jgi:hypothetical protein
MTTFSSWAYTEQVTILPWLSTHSAPTVPSQPRFEAEVRRMLRRARNPFSLSANPLAQALCETTGIANPQGALESVIAGAFGKGFPESRLRDMLLSSVKAARESEPPDASRVSRRHLQRRRAKAVAILASHIRKVFGVATLVSVEDQSDAVTEPPFDPLDAIAELVSNIEPAMASRIFRLGGPQSVANARVLLVRERAEMGADFDETEIFDRCEDRSIVSVLRAQAQLISGKENAAEGALWPLFGRLTRGPSNPTEIAFELEWLTFLRARQRGDAHQMDRVARNVKRLAGDRPPWVLRALLADAEAKIRRGRLRDATSTLDAAERRGLRTFALTELACSSALRSEIAFQGGDDAAAKRLATGAYFVLRTRHFGAYRCQGLVARARLRLGESWACPQDIGALELPAWDRVALNVEIARHLLAAGDAKRSRACALEAFQIAADRQYAGLAARAAATVGATFGTTTQQRRAWRLRALTHLVVTRDLSVGCDLFAQEQRELSAALRCGPESELAGLIYDGLLTAVPMLRAESHVEGHASRVFLCALITSVFGHTRESDRFENAISALKTNAPSFAQYFVHFAEEARAVIHTVLQAIAQPNARAKAEYHLDAALLAVAEQVWPRDNFRQFLVG